LKDRAIAVGPTDCAVWQHECSPLPSNGRDSYCALLDMHAREELGEQIARLRAGADVKPSIKESSANIGAIPSKHRPRHGPFALAPVRVLPS
jgi:hypothetical protein